MFGLLTRKEAEKMILVNTKLLEAKLEQLEKKLQSNKEEKKDYGKKKKPGRGKGTKNKHPRLKKGHYVFAASRYSPTGKNLDSGTDRSDVEEYKSHKEAKENAITFFEIMKSQYPNHSFKFTLRMVRLDGSTISGTTHRYLFSNDEWKRETDIPTVKVK